MILFINCKIILAPRRVIFKILGVPRVSKASGILQLNFDTIMYDHVILPNSLLTYILNIYALFCEFFVQTNPDEFRWSIFERNRFFLRGKRSFEISKIKLASRRLNPNNQNNSDKNSSSYLQYNIYYWLFLSGNLRIIDFFPASFDELSYLLTFQILPRVRRNSTGKLYYSLTRVLWLVSKITWIINRGPALFREPECVSIG